MSDNKYMLTTVDNPYSPFTHFREWLAFDASHGYDTAGFLARVTRTSSELSDTQQEQEVQDAIDEIVRENVLGVYRKVTKDSFKPDGD